MIDKKFSDLLRLIQSWDLEKKSLNLGQLGDSKSHQSLTFQVVIVKFNFWYN